MKKIIFLIFILSFTLTSCNVSNKQPKSYYKGLRKIVDKRKLQVRCPQNPN